MATNLIVRNVDAEIVKSLKEQAARNGRSAEAEHRGAGQKGTTVHNIVDELLSLFLNHDRIFLLNRFRLSPAHGQRVLPLVCTLYASGKEIGLKGN